MMTLNDKLDLALKAAAVVVALVSAIFALRTFRYNARTKAAEFLTDLHKAFFVDNTYKNVRDILDDDSTSAHAKLTALVTEQPAEFTDFLNFFELVAYMGKCATLSRGNVEALLGYYLQILTDKPELRGYIHTKKNGFERLDELLTWRLSRRVREEE